MFHADVVTRPLKQSQVRSVVVIIAVADQLKHLTDVLEVTSELGTFDRAISSKRLHGPIAVFQSFN
ncbi:hypothetical protein A471_04535 [Ectopseudomonas mendocina DLHK]|nr:hypothetical protein A471_04535 [Pseudomonas mendocina DLHK]ERH54141.1 hypothetical protein O203_06720 [Pseudomonas chengduensis]